MAAQGRIEEATGPLEAALRLKPGFQAARLALDELRARGARSGQPSEAVPERSLSDEMRVP